MHSCTILSCFEHLGSSEKAQKIWSKCQKTVIFGITFSMTVRIPYMRYECNFFNIEQIQHQICENVYVKMYKKYVNARARDTHNVSKVYKYAHE